MAKKTSTSKAAGRSNGVARKLYEETNAGGAEPKEERGKAGELHQTAVEGETMLTTQQGVPIADDQNTLRIGARGPALLEDFHFREKIFHFDHERIPERVVHARGYGAYGYSELTESLANVTRADIFQRKGERTEASADLARGP